MVVTASFDGCDGTGIADAGVTGCAGGTDYHSLRRL